MLVFYFFKSTLLIKVKLSLIYLYIQLIVKILYEIINYKNKSKNYLFEKENKENKEKESKI